MMQELSTPPPRHPLEVFIRNESSLLMLTPSQNLGLVALLTAQMDTGRIPESAGALQEPHSLLRDDLFTLPESRN